MSETVTSEKKLYRVMRKIARILALVGEWISRFVWLIPPIVVLIAMLITYKTNALYPFGEETISWGDMDQQVIPLMVQFKDILSGKDGALFSFNNACGMNFFGVFFFYLSSPFTFLVIFVDKADISSFMNVLVMLKMCTIALTASLYFYHKHPDKALLNVGLSVLYAFSGYVMMYYQNVVWLDCVYVFPLLLWGLERLKQGKRTMFIAALTAVMIFSYYIGYMVVVFILLYAFLTAVIEKNKKFTTDFWLSCGLAALFSAVVWLPSLAQYISSGRRESIVESLRNSKIFTSYQTAYQTILSYLFLFPFVFSANRKKDTDVAIRFYLFVLTLIPIFLEPINKMWQTGNYMCFPTRYGFITLFLCLSLAMDGMSKPKIQTSETGDETTPKQPFSLKRWWQENWRKQVPMYALSIALLISAGAYYSVSKHYILRNRNVVDQYSHSLWGNDVSFEGLLKLYAIAALVGVVWYLLYRFRLIKPVCLFLGVAIMVLSEIYVAPMTYMLTPAHSTEGYRAVMEVADQLPDEGFYRVKTDREYRGKDFDVTHMGALGYNAIGHFTSLTSANYMTAIKQFGYTSYWMEVGNSGGTILTDALLSVKYSLSTKDSKTDVVDGEVFHLSKTDEYLPLGIITKRDIISVASTADYTKRGELQATLYEDFFGVNDGVSVYTLEDELHCKVNNLSVKKEGGMYELKPKKNTASITFDIPVTEAEQLYFNAFSVNDNSLKQPINEKFKVMIKCNNGNNTSRTITKQNKYPLQRENGILDLGEYKNQTVSVILTVLDDVKIRDFSVIGIKTDRFSEQVAGAQTIGLEEDGSGLYGTYTAKSKECVFLSVPYNDGLTLKINGEQCPMYEVYDGFIGFYVQAGVNEIEITFAPQGMVFGFVLTVFGIGIGIFLCVWNRRKKERFTLPEKVDAIGHYLAIVAGVAVICLVYVLPIILCIT